MAVVNFVMSYYVWFLVGIILILLAIIGAYADKTNFGQGKKEENKNSDNEVDLKNVKLNDAIGNKTTKDGSKQENISMNSNDAAKDIAVSENNNIINLSNVDDASIKKIDVVSEPKNIDTNNSTRKVESKEEDVTSKSLNLDEKLSKLDSAINDMLPEKELIDTSILDDVSDIDVGLDDKKLFDNKDKFDLGDLKLPEIKKPKKQPKNVWKK